MNGTSVGVGSGDARRKIGLQGVMCAPMAVASTRRGEANHNATASPVATVQSGEIATASLRSASRRPGLFIARERRMRALGFLSMTAFFLTAVLLAGCSTPATPSDDPPSQSTTTRRVLAISTMPRTVPPPTAQDYADAAALARSAGAKGGMLTTTWSALEPTSGVRRYEQFKKDLSAHIAEDESVCLGLQVINTTTRELPADLRDLDWTSLKLRARFRAVIDSLVPALNARVKYLSIGNEVDVYLNSHPEEWNPYLEFYAEMVRYVHSIVPWVKVGVTGTFDGVSKKVSGPMSSLNFYSDVWIFTYYPLNADFTPRAPEGVFADLQRMTALAGSKPVVIQEAGYPASDSLGSTEGQQATFVRNLFSAWYAQRGRIPFLNYFLLHDFPPDLCDSLAGYYGLAGNRNFREYLCSLGLRKADGTPRAAWEVFVEEGKKIP